MTTTPLKWHGGKHYLADWIIGMMPEHVHYVEPFFGGGSVLLRKSPVGVSEVVNDIHGELSNFWCVLQQDDTFEAFQRRVEATPFSEYEWNQAAGPAGDDIDRAVRFFVRVRQSRQGIGRDFATLSRTRTRRGMNEQASAWLTAVEGLPEVHGRLKRVVILNRDAMDVIRQQDGPATLFYLDPPYLHETRASTGEYSHEMTTEQHSGLLNVLAGIKGKFLLSGYPSDLYASMADRHGWRFESIAIDNKASSAPAKPTKTECVWANFPA